MQLTKMFRWCPYDTEIEKIVEWKAEEEYEENIGGYNWNLKDRCRCIADNFGQEEEPTGTYKIFAPAGALCPESHKAFLWDGETI